MNDEKRIKGITEPSGIYAPYFSWERLTELPTALDALYLVTCSSGKIKRPNAEDKKDDYRYRMVPRKL